MGIETPTRQCTIDRVSGILCGTHRLARLGRGGHYVELLDRHTLTTKPHKLKIPQRGEGGMINQVKSVW